MHPLVTLIVREYNPKDCNFIRVAAADILTRIQQTQEELDEDWDTIFEELRGSNIFVQPALADVMPDEFVRIFRADSPVGQVILEALDPTANGDKLMAQAISRLNGRPDAGRAGRNGQARQASRGGSRHHQKRQQKRAKTPDSSLHRGLGEAPDPTHINKSSHYIRPLE